MKLQGALHGVIDYVGDDVGTRGREEWLLTVRPDGTRTVRAHCTMWDTGVARDVVHTVSVTFSPLRSFITQDVAGAFFGEGWFCFAGECVESAVVLAQGGRVDARDSLAGPPPFFVPHAVCCDSWIPAGYDPNGQRTQVIIGGWRSSPRADGASGPLAEPMPPLRVTLLGEEMIAVPAGVFGTRHFVLEQENGPRDEMWVSVDGNWFLVQLRCDVLSSWYRLTQLDAVPAGRSITRR